MAAGTCTVNGELQNIPSCNAVKIDGLQEKAGTTKKKLDRHHHMRSEGYGH